MHQKITIHLWFDTQAKEAAKFYTSVFEQSKIKNLSALEDTPSGSVDIVTMDIAGQEFTLLSAGPYFKINPSISFLVSCTSKTEVDKLWQKLSPGGIPRMELAKYPFSDWYGWIEDKFGVSWQIMLMGDRPIKQKITPTLMFVGGNAGKAEAALKFYTKIFSKSKIGDIMRYEAGETPDKPGTLKHASFILEGQKFAAMDSAYRHEFNFNEAVSLMIHCKNQAEIDYFWEKLSAVPKSEQCGWLKDKYGLSWQVVPEEMNKMIAEGTKDQVARVTAAFLKMKKFNIAKLKQAFAGI